MTGVQFEICHSGPADMTVDDDLGNAPQLFARSAGCFASPSFPHLPKTRSPHTQHRP
jgi:hypothetical protein